MVSPKVLQQRECYLLFHLTSLCASETWQVTVVHDLINFLLIPSSSGSFQCSYLIKPKINQTKINGWIHLFLGARCAAVSSTFQAWMARITKQNYCVNSWDGSYANVANPSGQYRLLYVCSKHVLIFSIPNILGDSQGLRMCKTSPVALSSVACAYCLG